MIKNYFNITILFFFLTACASGVSENVVSQSENPESYKVEFELNKKKNLEKRSKARELLLLADSAYSEKNWAESKDLYIEANELGAEDKTTLFRLGNLSILEGNFQDAQKYFTTVLSKEPDNTKAQYNLATVYLAQAEDHFQYYIATLNDEPIEDKLLTLLQSIEEFSNKQTKQNKQTTPLDSLQKLLQKQ